jgi:hypothetical protein
MVLSRARGEAFDRQESERKALVTVLHGEVAEWLTERTQSAKERRRNDGDPKGEERSDE